MVSVAFAMWALPSNAKRPSGPSQSAYCLCFHAFSPALTASDVPVYEAFDSSLASILHSNGQGRIRMMSMLYQAYQNHMDLTAPWRTGASQALKYLNLVPQGVSDKLVGRLAAALELISRTSLTYTRPPYGIDKVQVGNQELG